MAPDASKAPLTNPATMMTYFRKRRPRGVTRRSCGRPTAGVPSVCRTTRRSAPSASSPRQYHQKPRDRFFQAPLDLVPAGSEDVLAHGRGIVDVAVLAGELPKREHGPAARLVEGVEHLL